MAEIVEEKEGATKAATVIGKNTTAGTAGAGPGNGNLAVLLQHISEFDVNKDGILYPWETYAGLRRIAWSVIASSILTIVFHVTFSYASLPGWVPSVLFPVYIDNIRRNKQGDDTQKNDRFGSFICDDFEKLLSSLYPTKASKKLELTELWKMPEDIFLWIKEKAEWTALYSFARQESFSMSKDPGHFNRTLYEYVARKHAETKC